MYIYIYIFKYEKNGKLKKKETEIIKSVQL